MSATLSKIFRVKVLSANIYTKRDIRELKRILPEPKYKIDFSNSEIKNRKGLLMFCKDANGIITTNYQKFDRYVLANLKQLRIISFNGYWVDTVDRDLARKASIVVTNVPDYHIDVLADHTMTLILSSIRKVPLLERMVRQGQFNSVVRSLNLRSISNLNLGIIGFGKTGQALAKRSLGFGFKNVFAYDPYTQDWQFRLLNVKRKRNLEDLLATSDVITLHIGLTNETFHMFDRKMFNRMKKGTIIVNTSREEIIEERALIDAIHDGTVSFAGIDVFESEPLSKNSPLLKEKNVVLTPHVAAFSEDSRLYQLKECAARIKELAENKEIKNRLV